MFLLISGQKHITQKMMGMDLSYSSSNSLQDRRFPFISFPPMLLLCGGQKIITQKTQVL
jgi:hypothetical protein